jgi:Holliday junction resolvasome RuvABC ATP-dependent DNA helicase subunit
MHAVNVFLGNAGTGKSSVAGVLARMLHSLGELERDTVLEVDRKDLTSSGYHEEDDPCVDVIRRARGGVLLINDAHLLIDDKRSSDSSGTKAIHTLARECESGRNQTVLVLAGPRAEMEKFLNGGGAPLKRLVTNTLDFPDLSAEECAQVTKRVAQSKGFQLASGLADSGALAEVYRIKLRRADPQSSNGRCVHATLMEAIRNQTDRIHQKGTIGKSSLTTLEEEDFGSSNAGAGKVGNEDDGVAAALKKLDGVTGLPGVKNFVHGMVASLDLDQQRREAGLKPLSDSSLHMIFAGNPGTGKTTIARTVAEVLRSLGVLRVGHLVEADRSSLVAGYVGQTAIKTHEVVQSALGGVLFIDEAYSLVSNDKDTFGREALDTLIKLVEDYRDDLVVILAGYNDEMNVLLSHNPGVRSRFPTVIDFENYNGDELMEIFHSMLKSDDLTLDPAVESMLLEHFAQMSRIADKENGNGREVRNIIEQAKRKQALRLQQSPGRKSPDQLRLLTAADLGFGH